MKRFKLMIVAFTLCFGLVTTIQPNVVDAKKADVILKNKQKKITSITKYHNNNKVAYVEKNSYYSNGKLNKKTIVKYDTNGKRTYDFTRLGYSNGKAKQTTTHSSFINGNFRKRVINRYRGNGKIISKEVLTRNNSKLIIDNSKFNYNKMGQLKSNKYGAASKVVYKYYSNNKASSKTTYKYNAKGKLYGKVVNTKSFLKNKPKVTSQSPTQAELNKINDEIIRLVNVERAKLKVAKINKNAKLTNFANIRAKEISILFDHLRPNGSLCFDLDESIKAENVARNWAVYKNVGNKKVLDVQKSAAGLYKLWATSPMHYRNMTSDWYSQIGNGVYLKNGELFAVQLFGY